MAPASRFNGQVHRLPDAPEAYGAMITRAKAAPGQSRYADRGATVEPFRAFATSPRNNGPLVRESPIGPSDRKRTLPDVQNPRHALAVWYRKGNVPGPASSRIELFVIRGIQGLRKTNQVFRERTG